MKVKRHLRIPQIDIPLWWPDLPGNWRSWLPSKGNILFTTTLLALALFWEQTAGSLVSIPQAIITANGSLFLGITVGTDDEMAPRVQLGSVPFAVQALTVPDANVATEKIADGAITDAKLTAPIPKFLEHKIGEIVLSYA